MIGVKLWGGLGNQMFQYSFGLYLEEKRNEKPFYFNDFNKEFKFDLSYFNVEINELSKEVLNENRYGIRSFFLYRLHRKIIQLFPFVNKKILVENNLKYIPEISDEYVLFDGYWQSYKYLKPIEKKLREQFVLKNNILSDLELFSEIKKVNSVSLHIRRGDYLKGKNVAIFENVSIDYYKKAIRHFSKETIDPIFYIFSNDIEWVKNNLELTEKIKFIFIDNTSSENSAIADLHLISNCKHHILANSTFSWWGAWLNPSMSKIVVAPNKWYIGQRNDVTFDLIPSEWVRL
jgi:hypothetical protein